MARWVWCWLVVVAVAVVAARPAVAQEDAGAAAIAAFDEARRLMAKKQIAEACEKFGESQRLDPQLGTLLHWADCLERNGQSASAWARFRDAGELAAARDDRRQALAEQRAAKLLRRLSKLRVDVDPGNDSLELRVERDRVALGRTLWGTPSPVDPGEHLVTASAPGRKVWSTTVVVPADGSTVTVRVPELESVPVALPPADSGAAPAPTARERTPRADRADGSWLSRSWPVLLAGGVGLAGIGVGSVFGLSSQQNRDEADAYCDGRDCFDQRGVTLKQAALADGNVSTAAFIVGGVGLATAGVLWLALPGENEGAARPVVALGLTGVRVQGRF